MAIAKDIVDGNLVLPDLAFEHTEDYEGVWALVDSGSSVHVVDVHQVLPGAKITQPAKGAPAFKTANGGTVPNLGSTVVPFVTQEGQHKQVHWTHADVAMPIRSTHELARNDGELRYREDSGKIVNLLSNEETAFISAGWVYFLKMMVPKKFTTKTVLRPMGVVAEGDPHQLQGFERREP